MTDEQKTFLSKVCGPALATERDTGIPACVTVAQAILESAAKVKGAWTWGGSSLFRNANNPFGIKDSHFTSQFESESGDYGEYTVATHEIGADGQPHVELAHFSKFFSLSNAFRAHAFLFMKLRRYAPAMQELTKSGVRSQESGENQSPDPAWRRFATAIMNCGYSTDRPELCQVAGCIHYAGKLVKLIEQYKLDDPAVLNYYAGARAAGAAVQMPVEGTDL